MSLTRRGVLWGLPALASACAHGGLKPPLVGEFLASLPWETAGAPVGRVDGRVVLVSFIATWCFPCIGELLIVERLGTVYGPKGLSAILVGMDLEGSKVLGPFAEKYELKTPLVVGDDRLRAGQTPFGTLRELPARVLFGRDGEVRAAFSGVLGYTDLERLVVGELERGGRSEG